MRVINETFGTILGSPILWEAFELKPFGNNMETKI
jgi:hypothetical protein